MIPTQLVNYLYIYLNRIKYSKIMIDHSEKRLEYLCDIIPQLLSSIDEKSFTFKPSTDKWSKKEIIGHLIDSAANNHQRFIRCQFEDNPVISYDQNKWNAFSHYQQMPKEQLIDFWKHYNKHLAALIKLIPHECLQRTCKMKEGNVLTLEFLITDYVEHMEHHLKQIVSY